MTRIAALDIGSNSVLFAVAEPLPRGDFRVLYESARTTRLGEGMGRRRRLREPALRRTLMALQACRDKARMLDVALAKAGATAAVREAANQEDFLEQAREALGFGVEVLSAKREAELTYLGVGGARRPEPLLVIDVGSASTELVLGRAGRLERVFSLPLGAARLREAVPGEDFLRFFVQLIRVIPDELTPAAVAGRTVIVVGGTVTTLAAMKLELVRYDPDRVEGLRFTRDDLASLVDEIAGLAPGKRAELPGLPADRADIILSGGALLVQLLEDLGLPELVVSSRGLRHGLLSELARGKL